MKINYLILFLFVGVFLLGLTGGVFISEDKPEAIPERLDHNRNRTPENYAAASIPKGAILMLLAVGVIGALGVSRKKKDNGNDLNRKATDRTVQPPGADEDSQKLIGRNS